MHTVEVTILEPKAEEMLDEMESKNLITQVKPKKKRKNRLYGSMPGLVTYISEDFDEPLVDFEEYM